MNISTTETATYCPEDDKLRLYVGRVPRDEYEALRAQGWTSTLKQSCDFVAVWTPEREATALEYADGILDDEDQSPADRAADRAERFDGYLDKRREEAGTQADRYESGPQLHGYQSQAIAERRAARHDRIATQAVNSWEKAEYWQRRTAGVIGHALYVSTPAVRMGRIKTLEAELRKIEKDSRERTATNQATWDIWNSIAGNAELIVLGACAYSLQNSDIKPAGETGKYTREQCKLGMALMMIGNVHTTYGSARYELQKANIKEFVEGTRTPEDAAREWMSNHPERPQDWTPGGKWFDHITLRLAYENQMLEAQGGRAAFVEMEAGGWIGKHQIQKVNKSPATGRAVSVAILAPTAANYDRQGNAYGEGNPRPVTIHTLNIERLKSDVYRAPTDEERAEFKAEKYAKPKGPPTINPTMEDAQRLQEQLNAEDYEATKHQNYPHKPGEVEEMTQAQYSAAYADGKTIRTYRDAVKIRTRSGGWQYTPSLVVLTDKPQKPIPAEVFKTREIKQQELKIA